MEGERSQRALARIEAALARIDAAAGKLTALQPAQASANPAHQALRDEVASTIRDLDKLIAEMER